MIILALGFVTGVWCLQQQASLPDLLSLGLASLLLGLLFISSQTFLAKHLQLTKTSLFVFALSLGFLWAALLAQLRLSDALATKWQRQDVAVIGVIASLPEQHENRTRFIFDIEQVLTDGAELPTTVALNVYQHAAQKTQLSFHVGERWQFTVRLKRPHTSYNPNGFDYEAYVLSEDVRASGYVRQQAAYRKLDSLVWQPSYLIDRAREQLAQFIQHGLQDKPYAGVIQGLVIGDDSRITAADWQTFLATGTNHLMSISGLHITMLSSLLYLLTAFVWRRIPMLASRLATHYAASIMGMVTAMVYAALAGFSVPTQRTLYMLITVVVMLLLSRRISFANILGAALLVVLILDPWSVLAPGFWLSFMAVAVIVYASSARLASRSRLWEAANVQWSVTLGLIPILVLLFGQFSLLSPLANAIAIPLISLIVVPIAIFASFFQLEWLLQLSHWVMAICMHVLHYLEQSPLAVWQQAIPAVWQVLLAMFGIVWLLLPRGWPLRFLGLCCLLPMFLFESEKPKQGDMLVTVLDVGQGLSVVVQTAKHTLLYDAGKRFNQQSNAGNRIVMPYLRSIGIKTLDGIVVSHDDIDHSGGMLSVLEKYQSAWLISSLANDAAMLVPLSMTTHPPNKVLKCYAGQHWQWDGVHFEVLHPTLAMYQHDLKDNDKSCVIKISSHRASLLLTGDIEKASEYQLLERYADQLDSDVLIAPHHGSQTSSSRPFIQAVSPDWVVITNGYLNRFGHPKPAVVNRYAAQGAEVLRSDYHGAVQFKFSHHQEPEVLKWRDFRRRYWHQAFPDN